jgi:hypothetical protein
VKSMHPRAFTGAALVALLPACGGGETGTTGSGGSPGVGGSGVTVTAVTSATSTGSSASAGTGGEAPYFTYPDIATLHDLGVSRTCSLNGGVCHSQKNVPELTTAADFLATVGMPCQLAAQDPTEVIDQCEVPGDLLTLGGVDTEILFVSIPSGEPFPPKHLTLELAANAPSLDPTGARVRRLSEAKQEILTRALAHVQLSAGGSAKQVTLDLSGVDPSVAEFLDIRVVQSDRVRMGDANHNGQAHPSSSPWAEIVPGDPARSFLYQRLLSDKYGPEMPLIQREWSPLATRAVWCWIRGLPAGATPSSIGIHDAIDYASCPLDPRAPDPDATGGWPAVKLLMQSKCATSLCHNVDTQAAKLDLTPTPASFGAGVVNASSSQVPTALRVAPGQPSASYLLCKVDPACADRAAGTAAMPLGMTALSASEIKTVSDWILNGAKFE